MGGIPTPLKNMSSSVGMIVPNIWEHKKCSKPPTRDVHGYDVTSTDPSAFIHDEILVVAG